MRLLQKMGSIAVMGLAVLCVAAASLALPPTLWQAATCFLLDPVASYAAFSAQRQAQAVWRMQGQNGDRWPRATPTPQPTAAPTAAPTATVSPISTPEPSSTPSPQTTMPPGVKSTGKITAQQFPQGSSTGYITLTSGSIKNGTALPDATLNAATQGTLPFTVELNSSEPQVLILHTHATESYQLWQQPLYDTAYTARTKNTAQNMCAVGANMAAVLNAAGINTLHDETLHDDPSYTESYARSAATAKKYLAEYPSIKVILDVHRDAIEADGARVRPVCTVEGADTAQVMIIAGCDNGSTVHLPNWELNLRFAAKWEAMMEARTPGLTRPVLCGYRFYNQDLTTGSLLIEIGGHGNTLEEALRAGTYAAKALAALFGGKVD